MIQVLILTCRYRPCPDRIAARCTACHRSHFNSMKRNRETRLVLNSVLIESLNWLDKTLMICHLFSVLSLRKAAHGTPSLSYSSERRSRHCSTHSIPLDALVPCEQSFADLSQTPFSRIHADIPLTLRNFCTDEMAYLHPVAVLRLRATCDDVKCTQSHSFPTIEVQLILSKKGQKSQTDILKYYMLSARSRPLHITFFSPKNTNPSRLPPFANLISSK